MQNVQTWLCIFDLSSSHSTSQKQTGQEQLTTVRDSDNNKLCMHMHMAAHGSCSNAQYVMQLGVSSYLATASQACLVVKKRLISPLTMWLDLRQVRNTFSRVRTVPVIRQCHMYV